MFSINDAAKAKKSARALEKFLAKQGLELNHGQGLNAIAAMAGFEDWNGLQTQLKGATPADTFIPSIWDVDFRKVQVVNVFGSDFALDDLDDFDRVADWLSNWSSEDNPLRNKNPIALRLASQNEDAYGAEVLRVKELLSFKWDAKQQCFVSPSQGRMSLYELAPCQFKATVSNPAQVLQVTVKEKAVPLAPTILDVDFSRVTGMKKGGEGFWVDSTYYPEAMGWLHDWNNPANENDPDVPVLELTYIDDEGFSAHTQILADELLALQWSPSTGAFVSSEGVEYAFTAEQSVISRTLPRCLPVKVKDDAEIAIVPPRRFLVDVYSIESNDDFTAGREHVEAWHGTALDSRDAEKQALAAVWDNSLESAGAEPSCEVLELDDGQNGPFSVVVEEGPAMLRTNLSFSFKEACRLAAALNVSHGGTRVIKVLDMVYNELYAFNKT